jgi:hypothetical protein
MQVFRIDGWNCAKSELNIFLTENKMVMKKFSFHLQIIADGIMMDSGVEMNPQILLGLGLQSDCVC